jgi:hypothetical protein
MQKTLTVLFDIGNHSDKAMLQLSSLSMSGNPNLSSVVLYNTEWKKWLSYIPVAEWNSTAMSMLYEKGLRPRIREKLVEHRHAVRLFPSGSSTSQTAIQPRPRLLDLMEVAVEVEKMLKEVYDSRGSYAGSNDPRGGARVSFSSRPATAVSVNMIETADEEEDLQPGTEEGTAAESVNAVTAQPSTARKAATPSSVKKNVFLSLQDRQKLMSEGRCFNCYRKGHTKMNCIQQPALKKPTWPLNL